MVAMRQECIAGVFIAAGALCCAGSAAQAERALTIVALGDSTTAGTPGFRSPLESPPDGSGDERSQYAYWIMQAHPGWRVINQGVNAQRSDQILARFDSSVTRHRPDVVVVLAGVNDLYQGYPAERVVRNLKEIYRRAAAQRIRVVACTLLPYNGISPEAQARMAQVNAWIRSFSAESGLAFCDLFHALEHPQRPWALASTPDGLHPDVAGYRKMAEVIAAAIGAEPPASVTHAAGPTQPFRPAWWCAGPHAQTIWGSVLRPVPRVPVRRERWETPDGDFLDLDQLDGPAGSPVLVVLHGLEGSSRSKQVLGLLREARRAGWRAVALNFRSCSGQMNRLRRSYHAGETSDLGWVIDRLAQEDPAARILCAGFSLGGNVLLKYLGERGETAPLQLRAAVAISTPFDLAASARGLEKGFSRRYRRRIVAGLQRKTLQKVRQYPDLVDRSKLRAARTLEQFDDTVTAPVHGFRNAEEYWAASSSLQFLPRIRRPTLLINARDDPFLPGDLLPVREVAANPHLHALFTDHGGHMGFLSGVLPGLPAAWSESEALTFLKLHLRD